MTPKQPLPSAGGSRGDSPGTAGDLPASELDLGPPEPGAPHGGARRVPEGCSREGADPGATPATPAPGALLSPLLPQNVGAPRLRAGALGSPSSSPSGLWSTAPAGLPGTAAGRCGDPWPAAPAPPAGAPDLPGTRSSAAAAAPRSPHGAAWTLLFPRNVRYRYRY